MRCSALLLSVLCLGVASAAAGPALAADDEPAYGPRLEGFEYPQPVAHFSFTSQGEPCEMAYMDVQAGARRTAATVVLLHGKNFCAATWEDTITVLTDAGFRVDRARPDRLLQIEQARALPVHLPAARRKHACAARLRSA